MAQLESVILQCKDSVKNCLICNLSFSILLWKHHCYQCGAVVCDDCSKKKVYINHKIVNCNFNTKKPQRICNLCKLEYSKINVKELNSTVLQKSNLAADSELEREKRVKALQSRMLKEQTRGIPQRTSTSEQYNSSIQEERYKLLAKIEELQHKYNLKIPLNIRSMTLPQLKEYHNSIIKKG